MLPYVTNQSVAILCWRDLFGVEHSPCI